MWVKSRWVAVKFCTDDVERGRKREGRTSRLEVRRSVSGTKKDVGKRERVVSLG